MIYHNRNVAELSPALALLHQAYHAVPNRPSRARWKTGLWSILTTAVRMGLKFDTEDVAWLCTNTVPSYGDRSPYYFRSWGDTESLYSLACEVKNISACRAIEHHKGRVPFLWEQARLYVGRQVYWASEQAYVTCTSFGKDNAMVVLCSYQERASHTCYACKQHVYDAPTSRRKLAHLYKFTHEDLQNIKLGRYAGANLQAVR